MSATLIDPPALEPVSLAEAKAHLRLAPEASEEDDLLAALIVAARIHVERATRLVFVRQTWRLHFDAWPADGVLTLPVNPVAAVEGVAVVGDDGTATTLAPTAYVVDAAGRPGRIALAAGTRLPPHRRVNGIEIALAAGFGPSGVDTPQPLRLAIMMLATRWYEGRDGVTVGVVPADIADAFQALVAPYRVVRL